MTARNCLLASTHHDGSTNPVAMRQHAPMRIWSSSRSLIRPRPTSSVLHRPSGCRFIQLNALPTTSTPILKTDIPVSTAASPIPAPDAQFEVLGSPYSLLSVQLSASQNLYTRQGTLVAINGNAENTVSTLSVLKPFRRSIVGIPFLYQRISSTTPITALISSKSPITSVAVVNLDGRLDWIVAQRDALLAWTGHALSVRPKIDTRMSLAHWGNSHVTGRGLLALVGKGQIYQVHLKAGEEYIAHPGNVIAYTVNQNPPLPYRFKSSVLRFQIPAISLGALVPDVKFFRELSKSTTWKTVAQLFFNIRTWARRSIWGDRLFLRFSGPTTILLQSRGSRITDALTLRDVNEIADTPAGTVQAAVKLDLQRSTGPKAGTPHPSKLQNPSPEGKIRWADVGKDGKVQFKDS